MRHVNDAGPEVLRQGFKYLSPLWDHTLKSNLLVSGNSKYQRTLLPGNLIVSQLDLWQLVLYEEGWFACLLLYRCCLTSIYLSVNSISYYFMFGIHPCAARSWRQRLFVKQSYLLVLERSSGMRCPWRKGERRYMSWLGILDLQHIDLLLPPLS